MALATGRRIPRPIPFQVRAFASLWTRGFVSNSADLLALFVGLTAATAVHFVGDLPISEIILIPLLPILLVARGQRVLKPEFKIAFFLLAFWLFGQVISDIYRGSAAVDWMRGNAAIVFFGLDLLGLVILLQKNERRKAIFITGSAIGQILVTVVQPSKDALNAPWKFGYASGIMMLVLLLSSYFYSRRIYLIAGLLIAGIACINVLENFRSPIGELLIVVALVFPVIPDRIGSLVILPRPGSALRVGVLLVLALSAAWTAATIVKYATSAGFVSEEAREKNEAQGSAGLLLGGRPEIQVSSRAVLASPILGYGSWPKDSKYVEMLFDIQVEQGILDDRDIEELSTDLIPTHSHLMGAWVWAGILGAVFWSYILWLAFKAIIWISTSRPSLAPVYAYLGLGFVWNILFSPFGLGMRVGDALTIVIICDLLETQRSVSRSKGFVRQRRRPLYFRGRWFPLKWSRSVGLRSPAL